MKVIFNQKIRLALFAIFAILWSGNLFSQILNSVVMHEPKYANNMIILDGSNYGVATWVIKFIEREYSPTGNHTDVFKTRHTLGGINHFRIPNNLMLDTYAYEYLFGVEGYSSSGTKVVDEPYRPCTGDGTPFVENARWVCNGTTYAYEIVQYTNAAHSIANYTVQGTYTLYQYLNESEWALLFDEGASDPDMWSFTQVHGLDFGWTQYIDDPDNSNAISIDNNNDGGITYFNINGNLITDNIVHGVRKWMDYYWPSGSIQANGFTNVNNMSTLTLDQIIQWMNNNSNIQELIDDEWFDDLLFCEDNTWTLGDGNGNGDTNDLLDCYMNNPNWNEDPNDNVDYDGDDDIDIWDDYEYIQNCDDLAVLGQIADIDFVKEEGTGSTNVLHLEKEELYDNSGNWIAPTFALPVGLYWIGFDVEGSGYISFYREVHSRLTNTSSQATQLDVTVFPVPIENNSFSLHLKANANLSFQYQLLSGTGAILHSELYKLGQDYEEDVRINSSIAIPVGLVLHKFILNDGSVKTITTVRSN